MNKDNHVSIDISNCCGCYSCYNICPRKAIEMKKDRFGFVFPQVDEILCVQCGLCKKACGYQESKLENKNTITSYAVMAKDETTLMKSSSGGFFKVAAEQIIKQGGCVFGCSLEMENNFLVPRHIKVCDIHDLEKLQGSKYVQSVIGEIYKEVKEELDKGRKVLFSGTPCQIDGLYHYLLKKKYDNLLTIDLICHGVPSTDLFQKYIVNLEKKIKGNIVNVCFRDKTKGWSFNSTITYKDKKGNLRKKMMPLQGFSYYKLFLDSEIYRQSCYSCKYADCQRVGDFTIGDYWGIEEEHSDILTKNGGTFDASKGVSCVLVNTNIGLNFLEQIKEYLEYVPSSIEKIKKHNNQLRKPSKMSDDRDKYLEMCYLTNYDDLEKNIYKKYGIKGMLYQVWNYIPGKRIR